MGRVKRPSLFESNTTTKSQMKALGSKLVDSTLNTGMMAAKKSGSKDAVVKKKPKYLEVTEKRMSNLGVIDLKPYFARSPHRVQKEGGGWYLRIPIKRKARGMSRRMYEQLRAIDIAPDERRTVVSDYLYDRRRQSEATMLNYEPKSKNIEKKKSGKNRHTYTVFRTVSDKSPASSWVVGRDKVNSDDTSKTFVRNVNRLMKWKMKNGWE
jgi:hypothetical protein